MGGLFFSELTDKNPFRLETTQHFMTFSKYGSSLMSVAYCIRLMDTQRIALILIIITNMNVITNVVYFSSYDGPE